MSIASFWIGGVAIAAVVNLIPAYVVPLGIFLALIWLTYIYCDVNWRGTPFSYFCFWILIGLSASVAILSWVVVFGPIVEREEIEKAKASIAANTGQCADLGRKNALELLAKKGQSLSGLDLDCAELADLKLPPNTKLRPAVSMVGMKSPRGIFSGVNMGELIASKAYFAEANFNGAILEDAILGRHVLFDKLGRPRCYPGADVTGAIFDGADLRGAYLVGVKGLNCEQLKKAIHWSQAVRDEECGEPIPVSPKYDYVKDWPLQCDK